MKAYLFDFDGTLVDSMPTYISAVLKILDDNNISYSDNIVKIITPLGMEKAAHYFIDMRVNLSKYNIIARIKNQLIPNHKTKTLCFFIHKNIYIIG